jgi:hypothetical protein
MDVLGLLKGLIIINRPTYRQKLYIYQWMHHPNQLNTTWRVLPKIFMKIFTSNEISMNWSLNLSYERICTPHHRDNIELRPEPWGSALSSATWACSAPNGNKLCSYSFDTRMILSLNILSHSSSFGVRNFVPGALNSTVWEAIFPQVFYLE